MNATWLVHESKETKSQLQTRCEQSAVGQRTSQVKPMLHRVECRVQLGKLLVLLFKAMLHHAWQGIVLKVFKSIELYWWWSRALYSRSSNVVFEVLEYHSRGLILVFKALPFVLKVLECGIRGPRMWYSRSCPCTQGLQSHESPCGAGFCIRI